MIFFIHTTLSDFMTPTRLPLLTGTGAAGLLLYLAIRRRLEPRYRVAALLLALAPLASANTQVLAGFIQTPHNLEQNFGVIALATVCILAIRAVGHRPWMLVGAAAASCGLLAVYASHVFVVNASVLERTPPSSALLDALKTEPQSVVMADPDLADLFSLAAPQLHFSALARSQTLRSPDDGSGGPSTADRFQNYLCVKRLLAGHQELRTFDGAFQTLDQGFRYLNQDFPLIHLNRKHTFRPAFDASDAPRQCTPRTLQIFPSFVLGAELGRPMSLTPISTPQARWAYASVVELKPAAGSPRVTASLMDVRAQVTVTHGCIALGVLTSDQRAFVTQTSMTSAEAVQVADLLVEPAGAPNWLAISNCSAAGASEGVVHAVQMFPVESTTVRSVADAAAEALKR